MPIVPHDYQYEGVDWACRRFIDGIPGSMICADPGLGKTLMTLMIYDRLKALGVVDKMLIVAPLIVAYKTWPDEIRKFIDAGLIDSFDFVVAHGTFAERREAFSVPYDIYITNTDGVKRLAEEGCPDDIDLLVIDESTEFKSWASKRVQALSRGYNYRKRGEQRFAAPILDKFPLRLELTGTPTPLSFVDMYAQFYILDGGATLGRTKAEFERNFYRNEIAWAGGRRIVRKRRSVSKLFEAIAPHIYRLDEKDHIKLPPRIDVIRWVDLPKDARKKYNKMEREYFYELEQAEEIAEITGSKKGILAATAGAKYQICKGLANGGIYERDEDGKRVAVHHVHDAKTDSLESLIEELHHKPVLVAYQYEHDLRRLLERFPKARVIKGGRSTKAGMRETNQTIDDWNAGKIQVLLVQPAALSYGANLQYLSDIIGNLYFVWYGLTDNLLHHDQICKRLHRQGVKGSVFFYYLLADNTVDVGLYDGLVVKSGNQRTLLDAMRAYRRKQQGHDNVGT